MAAKKKEAEGMLKKKDFTGKEVEILGPTYEKGIPASPGNWRANLKSRDEILNYIKTAERYWYAKEGFGSEKRKTPA